MKQFIDVKLIPYLVRYTIFSVKMMIKHYVLKLFMMNINAINF